MPGSRGFSAADGQRLRPPRHLSTTLPRTGTCCPTRLLAWSLAALPSAPGWSPQGLPPGAGPAHSGARGRGWRWL